MTNFHNDHIRNFTAAVAGFEVSKLQQGDPVADMLHTSWQRTGLVPEQQKSDQMWFNQAADIIAEIPPNDVPAFIKQVAESTNNKFAKLSVENFVDRYLQPIAQDHPIVDLIGNFRAGMAEITDGFTAEQQQKIPSLVRFENKMARFAPGGVLPGIPENPQTEPEQYVGKLFDVWKEKPDDYYQAAYLTINYFDESRNTIHDVLNDPQLKQQRYDNRLAQIKQPDMRPVAPLQPGIILGQMVTPPDDAIVPGHVIFVDRPKIDNQPFYDSMLARKQATLVEETQKLDQMPRNDWQKIEQQFVESGLYKDPKAACKNLHNLMVEAHQSENPYRAFNQLSTQIADDPSILGAYNVKREGFWENVPFLNGQKWAEDRVKYGAWQKVLFAHDVIRTESSVRFQTETVDMHRTSTIALMEKGPSVFDLLDRPEPTNQIPDHNLESYRGRAPKQERKNSL